MMVSQITAWEGGVDGEDEGLAGQVAWIQTNTCLVFQLKREEKSVIFFREVRENDCAGYYFSMRGWEYFCGEECTDLRPDRI